MRKRIQGLALGVALAGLQAIGCSGGEPEDASGELQGLSEVEFAGNGSGSAADDAPVFEGKSEDLHAFTLNGERIAFTAVETPEGDFDLIVSVEQSDYRTTNAIDLINAQAEDLTDLERFYALAGRDAVPHPLLVEYHAKQAAAWGREAEPVRYLEVDFDAPVPKRSESSCDDFVFTDQYLSEETNQYGNVLGWWNWYNKLYSNNLTSSTASLCTVNGNCTTYNRGNLVAGGCTYSNNTHEFRLRMRKEGGSWYTSDNWQSVKSAIRYYKTYSGDDMILRVYSNRLVSGSTAMLRTAKRGFCVNSSAQTIPWYLPIDGYCSSQPF